MEKLKHIIVCTLESDEIRVEDSGQAKIFSASQDDVDENGMFFRVCSWDQNKIHSEFNNFIGKKIKITIEEI